MNIWNLLSQGNQIWQTWSEMPWVIDETKLKCRFRLMWVLDAFEDDQVDRSLYYNCKACVLADDRWMTTCQLYLIAIELAIKSDFTISHILLFVDQRRDDFECTWINWRKSRDKQKKSFNWKLSWCQYANSFRQWKTTTSCLIIQPLFSATNYNRRRRMVRAKQISSNHSL